MKKASNSWLGYLGILSVGIVFGITLTQAEIISWYRIQEMFRFQSFHMYGVIGTAVILGILINQIFKRLDAKTVDGEPLNHRPKEPGLVRYLLGGTIFGLGWAMTGACPGPLYILLGSGYTIFLMATLGAVLGTFTYGLLRSRLPH
ncbi:MAG: YeeE/YedE thiosulfate transporter family protein [Bacteroidia bacterium]|nr:YeeE/YedE thiosulfate transporter family protein [Bacteroidia bacterium]